MTERADTPSATRSLLHTRRSFRSRWTEGALHGLFFLCGILSVLTTIGIIGSIFFDTVGFFREVSILEFLSSTEWTPLFLEKHFGVIPLVAATMLIAGIAMAVALPIGLATAIFLSEYAPDRMRRVVKPILEVLAGIPTVVYGYFALTFVTPQVIQSLFSDALAFNALSAGVVMGVMIIPMVSSLSEDAMVAVPRSLREAGYALGGTRFEVSTRVVVPAALSAIVAAFILAFSRAVGETMIVYLAAGGSIANLTWNPLEAMQTMTAAIVQISLGDTPYGTLEYRTIFAIGMTLFVMTLIMNILGHWFVKRYREVY